MAKNRVGAVDPTRFLAVTEEDPLSEIIKITHTKAYSLLVMPKLRKKRI